MRKFSPYKVTWIEIHAVSGKVTLRDIAKIRSAAGVIMNDDREDENAYLHFINKASAEAWVARLVAAAPKFSKKYEIRYFSDKQFGMRSKENGYKVPFTRKQLAEVVII